MDTLMDCVLNTPPLRFIRQRGERRHSDPMGLSHGLDKPDDKPHGSSGHDMEFLQVLRHAPAIKA